MTATCTMIGCTAEEDLKRRHRESGEVYPYCADHDPLDDDTVAPYFEPVSDDADD